MENFIKLDQLCVHYQVERSFFNRLDEFGLIKVEMVENLQYVREDAVSVIEKLIRLNRELDLNLEGMDVVMNLLQKITEMQEEMNALKNRLRLYES